MLSFLSSVAWLRCNLTSAKQESGPQHSCCGQRGTSPTWSQGRLCIESVSNMTKMFGFRFCPVPVSKIIQPPLSIAWVTLRDLLAETKGKRKHKSILKSTTEDKRLTWKISGEGNSINGWGVARIQVEHSTNEVIFFPKTKKLVDRLFAKSWQLELEN